MDHQLGLSGPGEASDGRHQARQRDADGRVRPRVERHRACGRLAGTCKFGEREALLARHGLPLGWLRWSGLSRCHVREATSRCRRLVYPRFILIYRIERLSLYGRSAKNGIYTGPPPSPCRASAGKPEPMQFVDLIARKRDGEALSREAIDLFVAGVVGGQIPDYQASALL